MRAHARARTRVFLPFVRTCARELAPYGRRARPTNEAGLLWCYTQRCEPGRQTHFLKPVLGCPRTRRSDYVFSIYQSTGLFSLSGGVAWRTYVRLLYNDTKKKKKKQKNDSRHTAIQVERAALAEGRGRGQIGRHEGWERFSCQELINGRRRRFSIGGKEHVTVYIQTANGSSRPEDSYRRYIDLSGQLLCLPRTMPPARPFSVFRGTG